MTLWHKQTEKPRRRDCLIVFRLTKGYKEYVRPVDYFEYKQCYEWCYLSDLLKLERENKRLKKKLEK